jgi:aspartokinase
MALIVQKYGGTSVANTERIKEVAARVIATRNAGHDVVVVLSAMAGETDRLIQRTPGNRTCCLLRVSKSPYPFSVLP